MEITLDKAYPRVMEVLKAGYVPFIHGGPGIGKSDLAKQIARDNNLEYIDIRLSQCDPADMQGFPMKTENGRKATYLPMDIFPLEGDPLPEGKNGWLINMDEFNSAPLATQAAAYKIVLDKMVGMKRLHPKVAMIAMGNRLQDKGVVNRMPTPLQSRFIHFEIMSEIKGFMKWADKNDLDYRIKAFLNFKPEFLNRFDPNHDDMTYACNRTWAFLSQIMTKNKWEKVTMDHLPTITGTIGEGVANEFFGYCEVFGSIPTFDQIMDDPLGIPIGDDPGIQHALTCLVASEMTEKNADRCMKFLNRMEIDFQVIALRSAISNNVKIKGTRAVRQWVSDNARELNKR